MIVQLILCLSCGGACVLKVSLYGYLVFKNFDMFTTPQDEEDEEFERALQGWEIAQKKKNQNKQNARKSNRKTSRIMRLLLHK